MLHLTRRQISPSKEASLNSIDPHYNILYCFGPVFRFCPVLVNDWAKNYNNTAIENWIKLSQNNSVALLSQTEKEFLSQTLINEQVHCSHYKLILEV